MERTVSTWEFSATADSTRRVTRSSIRSASIPGQGMIAIAEMTGMSGSRRCGIRKNPTMPQSTVATRASHATWRCSVKYRAVLVGAAMRSASVLWAMGKSPYGMIWMGCPSATMVAPRTMTRAPASRPSRTAIRLPLTSPSRTRCSLAVDRPAESRATNTP